MDDRQLLDVGERAEHARAAHVHLVEAHHVGERPLGRALVPGLDAEARAAPRCVELEDDQRALHGRELERRLKVGE
eukprot:4635792-Prymnesium_polylepis.1